MCLLCLSCRGLSFLVFRVFPGLAPCCRRLPRQRSRCVYLLGIAGPLSGRGRTCPIIRADHHVHAGGLSLVPIRREPAPHDARTYPADGRARFAAALVGKVKTPGASTMSFNAHIRGSLDDLRRAALEPAPFPPHGAARLVADAINILKVEARQTMLHRQSASLSFSTAWRRHRGAKTPTKFIGYATPLAPSCLVG